ncbi:MAG: hypothetical protein KDC78_03310 [Aequorivita sp.]|nr:hypothetical protein [Aequorivita sp.]
MLTTVAIIAIIIGYNYLYKDHRNIESEKAQYSLTAQQIHIEYNNDPIVFQNKYLNKTIEIIGFVSEIGATEITLDDMIFCQFSKQFNQQGIKLNSKISIKGRFIGYDDLLEQLKFDQCIIT